MVLLLLMIKTSKQEGNNSVHLCTKLYIFLYHAFQFSKLHFLLLPLLLFVLPFISAALHCLMNRVQLSRRACCLVGWLVDWQHFFVSKWEWKYKDSIQMLDRHRWGKNKLGIYFLAQLFHPFFLFFRCCCCCCINNLLSSCSLNETRCSIFCSKWALFFLCLLKATINEEREREREHWHLVVMNKKRYKKEEEIEK